MNAPFRATIAVRWADLDPQGHVNNAVIADYLQEARAAFFTANGPADLLGNGIVVVWHQINYTAAVDAGDPVEAEIWIADVGASRLQVAYHLFQRGVEVAAARTMLCLFDFAAGRPVRLTPMQRTTLRAHLRTTEKFAPLPGATLTSLRGRGFETQVPARWSDEDRYRHVNNVIFFDYVQQARIDMTTHLAPEMSRGTGDNLWLIGRQDMDYLAPMQYRLEPYRVRTAPVRLGRTSIGLVAEIVGPDADEVVYARARTVLVCADRSGRPMPLPESTRTALTPWLVTEG